MERSQKSLVTDDEPLSLFVSYAREDEAFVDELTAGLEARGYDVWRDLDDIPPAADWRDEIQDGIDRCEALVIVMSPASLASTEVAKEVEIAHAHGKRLVPVMSRAVDPREAHEALVEQARAILAARDSVARLRQSAAQRGEDWSGWYAAHPEPPCPCECQRGEFCGGCGHRGCGRR